VTRLEDMDRENSALEAALAGQRRAIAALQDPSPNPCTRVNNPDEPVMPFTSQCIGTFRGHTGPVWVLASYKDFLLSGSSDEIIKVWDMNNFDCVKSLTGHHGVIHSLAVAADRLASINQHMQPVSECTASKDIVSKLAVANNKVFSASFCHSSASVCCRGC